MKDLRNNIREAADRHSEAVDHDAIWAGIEHKMNGPKKKRRFIPFLLWGISISFVALGVIGFYILDENNMSHVNNDKSNIELEINHEDSQKSHDAIEIESSTLAMESNSSLNEKSGELGSEEVTKPEKESSLYTSTTALNENVNQIKNIEANKLFARDIEHSEDDSPVNEKIIADESNRNIVSMQSGSIIERGVIDIYSIGISLNLYFDRPKIEMPMDFVLSPPPPSDKGKKFSFFNTLTVYGQYGFGSKSIISDSGHAALRRASEDFLEQWRIGVETDVISFLDFSLYAGASYVSINDRVSKEEEYMEDREFSFLSSVVISPDGSEEQFFDSGNLPHLVNKQSLRYNSHRFVSMPIGLRFGKNFSKLRLGIGFGLDFNYYLSDTHTIMDEAGNLSTIPVGGKWISPSLHTAISVDYPILDGWYLHSKLMYRSTSFENGATDNIIRESYTLYGIDLGLKFQF